MAKPAPAEKEVTLPPPTYSPLAGFLSYLVPGLGQIYQGRVGKGVLFLVCVLGLFFCGMALGSWKNVYIPDEQPLPRATLNLRILPTIELKGVSKALYYRLQFLGQFWMGVASWPAIWQYAHYDENREGGALLGDFERAPREEVVNQLTTNGDKNVDLGWVYTVIAGVLNILVIYDAFAGPFYTVVNKGGAPEASAT